MWEALQVFNQRQVQPGIALNRIYDLLFWLNNNQNQQQVEVTNKQTPVSNKNGAANNNSNNQNPSNSNGTSHEDSEILGASGKREYIK